MVDAVSEKRISPRADENSGVENTAINQYQRLLKQYHSDILLNPASDKLFAERAKVYLQLAKTQDDKGAQRYVLRLALNDYARAIELSALNPDYFAERAECYYQLRQFEFAMADYLQAAQLNPANAHYQNKVKRLQLLKRQATVIRFLKKVRFGVDIMICAILFALAGAVIWGLGEIAYGAPFMLIALAAFIYGLVKVLKSEISLYELQR